MLREYDFTIIAKGDLPEGESQKVIQGYEALMVKDGGEILKRDEWGNKRLAFPIKKTFRGFYVNYDFVGSPDNVKEIERLIRIDDNILRHLVVRLDESREGTVDVEARKAEMIKQEKEARERDRGDMDQKRSRKE